MPPLRTALAPLIEYLEEKHGPMPNWPSLGPPPAPEYACNRCRDIGWVTAERPNPNPQMRRVPHFVAVPCPDCGTAEDAAERAERLWRLAGVSESERSRYTFSSFNLSANPSMAPALAAAQQWAAGDGLPFLILVGPRGLGKTHLAVAAAAACIARGEAVSYHVVPRFLRELRATQARDEGQQKTTSLEAVLRGPLTYPAVILDDLGAQRDTAFADEQLYDLVDERWSKRRRTIITTNVGRDRLEDRVSSRLLDWQTSRVIACTGRDYRQAAAR